MQHNKERRRSSGRSYRRLRSHTIVSPGSTYLLVGGGSLENVVHQSWEDLGHPEYTGTVRAILRRASDFLVLLLGQVYPLPDYRVNEI